MPLSRHSQSKPPLGMRTILEEGNLWLTLEFNARGYYVNLPPKFLSFHRGREVDIVWLINEPRLKFRSSRLYVALYSFHHDGWLFLTTSVNFNVLSSLLWTGSCGCFSLSLSPAFDPLLDVSLLQHPTALFSWTDLLRRPQWLIDIRDCNSFPMSSLPTKETPQKMFI